MNSMVKEKDRLTIAKKGKKTIEYILSMTNNYPHKYLELKIRIINTSFDILELIYISNIDRSKKRYLIPKLKMLDYYLKLSYKNNIISAKKYQMVALYLEELVKMIIGWSNEENK